MKHILLSFLGLVSFMSIYGQERYNNFIRQNGEWKMIDCHAPSDSACHFLGYNDEMCKFTSGPTDSKIWCIYRKLFSGDIIVATTKDNIKYISDADIDEYSEKYNQEYENYAINIENILLKGIEKKSLPIGYICEVMEIPNFENQSSGIFESSKYKYRLTFCDGVLTAFEPTDGLNKYARFYQAGNYFHRMEKYAKSFWENNNDKIIWELNTQSNAWFQIPAGLNNKNCYMFVDDDESVCNVKIMNIALYGDIDITEKQFKDITHNRANFDGEMSYYQKNCRRYSYMNFYFLFDLNGVFIKSIEK